MSGFGAGAVAHACVHRDAHAGEVSARAGLLPAHRGPAGHPDGALGSVPVVDSGSARHGDAHAVTPGDRLPLRLVPGGAVRADAAETRDRYRDIPVFPG
ncbi:hypothetical protein [Streptomyces sp. NPDC003247]|uniref:hypothetical protein n=1 Tax=Streptomyces sp. NPDC003247 TaxID=3364677 RepID=UPI0036B9FD36